MNAQALFGLAPLQLARSFRRWHLRRQLANVRYQRAQIVQQRENDTAAERMLQAREAILQSNLRNI